MRASLALMKKPACCRATLIEVREHLRFVAARIDRDHPEITPKEVLERIAATLEAAMDPEPDPAVALGRVAEAVRTMCASCGGSGWAAP